MRKNQITITVVRYGDEIPKSVTEERGEELRYYRFSTYTDSNNVFEALAAANANILNQIKLDEDFPKFGDEGKVKREYGYMTFSDLQL